MGEKTNVDADWLSRIMPNLSPGLGAEATVITKKMKPCLEGGLPNEIQALVTKSASAAIGTIESRHRSKIILTDFVKLDKSICYNFYLYADNESGNDNATLCQTYKRG